MAVLAALGVAAVVVICLAIADLYAEQAVLRQHQCQVTRVLWAHQDYINHRLGLPPLPPLPPCPR